MTVAGRRRWLSEMVERLRLRLGEWRSPLPILSPCSVVRMLLPTDVSV
jgi:hypothetical protein